MISETIPSLLYQYSIFTLNEDHLLKSRLILGTFGFDETSISETFEKKCWCLKVFSEDKNRLDRLKESLNHSKIPGVKVSLKVLKPKDWLTRWKDQWKPLALTKKIDVIPFSFKDRYQTSKKVILLDTLMSFGTGMHETTQLIAQLIEDNASELSTFLDIGTGTGILALVALKNGAKSVTAMDVSPLSIEAAQINFKVNEAKAKLILSDIDCLSSANKYRTVAANLITEDLLKNRRKLLSLVKPGGLLMVSGISLNNLKKLKEGFKDLPLTCQKVSQGKEWAAILYKKKM